MRTIFFWCFLIFIGFVPEWSELLRRALQPEAVAISTSSPVAEPKARPTPAADMTPEQWQRFLEQPRPIPQTTAPPVPEFEKRKKPAKPSTKKPARPARSCDACVSRTQRAPRHDVPRFEYRPRQNGFEIGIRLF